MMGRISHANDKFLENLGYSEDELTNNPFSDNFITDRLDNLQNLKAYNKPLKKKDIGAGHYKLHEGMVKPNGYV